MADPFWDKFLHPQEKPVRGCLKGRVFRNIAPHLPMMETYPQDWPQFLTSTINDWKHLLKESKYKDIVVNCLKYLVDTQQIRLNAFVIMDNHFHLIWQATCGHLLTHIETNFLKITASKFKLELSKSGEISKFRVPAPDRKYNFWKRDSLGIELFTPAVFRQKLNYIHNNPLRAGLCDHPAHYHYSSALFYEKGIDHFKMIEHYNS